MKKLIIIALLFAFTSISYSQMGMMMGKNQKPFISEWTTTRTPQTITLPLLSSGGQYDFTIDWGDGTVERITTNSAQHTYGIPDTYIITISGLINGWRFDYTGDKNVIRDISQWGCLKGAGERAFAGCTKLDVTATDQLNTEGITNFSFQFANCWNLTMLNVSSWDVSGGTNFQEQFINCYSLTTLDVSNWDVSTGANFYGQFANCNSLTTLDVSDWDVSNGTDFTFFMFGVTMTTPTYNQTLINWDALTLKPGAGASMNFGSSKYNRGGAAETARTNIINNDGWAISDGGGI